MLHTGPPFWYDGPFFIYTADEIKRGRNKKWETVI